MDNFQTYQAKVMTPAGVKVIGMFATEVDALTAIALSGFEGRVFPLGVDFDPLTASHLKGDDND